MDNILISGVTGFVGQNLSSYLSSEVVKGVSRIAATDATTISYEQLSLAEFNQAKAFVHLAGKAHDLKKTAADEEYYKVNTELTKKLFDKFLKSKCEVFVFMSTVKAVADEVTGILNEAAKPNPITVYGKSKLAAETYLLNQKLPDGKRLYILRPCMIHGPGNKGNLNLLYNFVSKGIPYPFGAFKNERSFLSIDNLCFVIKELLDNDKVPNGIYQLADDNTFSTTKLVQMIGSFINKPVKIMYINKKIIKLLAKFGDVLPLPVNTERLQKLTEDYCVSNAKIKIALGKELPMTIEEGLQKTILSFEKNNK